MNLKSLYKPKAKEDNGWGAACFWFPNGKGPSQYKQRNKSTLQTPSSTQVCLRILDGAGEEQDEPAEGRAANDDGSFSDGPGQPRRLEGEFASSTVNLGQGVRFA